MSAVNSSETGSMIRTGDVFTFHPSSRLVFTLATYVHPDQDAAAETVERLGQALACGEIWGESFPHVDASGTFEWDETAGHGLWW